MGRILTEKDFIINFEGELRSKVIVENGEDVRYLFNNFKVANQNVSHHVWINKSDILGIKDLDFLEINGKYAMRGLITISLSIIKGKIVKRHTVRNVTKIEEFESEIHEVNKKIKTCPNCSSMEVYSMGEWNSCFACDHEYRIKNRNKKKQRELVAI